MRLYIPPKFKFQQRVENDIILGGDRNEDFRISVLEDDIVRVCHNPRGGTKFEKTWIITDKEGNTPLEGRAKNDYSRFSLPYFAFEQKKDERLFIETKKLRLRVELAPLQLFWSDIPVESGKQHSSEASIVGGVQDGVPDSQKRFIAEDLNERAYCYEEESSQIYHFMKRSHQMRFYGFGEKTGKLNKHGRRLRMFNLDAGRYNAELSDPLYKHVPFYITYLPEQQIAYGILYDSLATCNFDMGSEHHNFLPAYRYYQAEDGALDYYFIYGPTIREVLEKFASLTGYMSLPPRWSLGYMGSTMSYTEADNAQEELKKFPELCDEHDIPCDLFHLSSGYTKKDDGKRYVFYWNRERVPEPHEMVANFHDSDIKLAANVKPCLLTTHPRFEEVRSFNGFVNTADGTAPQLDKFWDGDGAHLDFTSEKTFKWWKDNIKEHLLDYGIDAIWNDNNEFTIWDDQAKYNGFGETYTVSEAGRPLQTLLMARASHEILCDNAPDMRPYVITRSGCPGIQRYAQTWTGDNDCNWHTLQFNIPMGLGLSLSGMPNIGHDVGGFFGNKPDPELFVRWIQNGIFHPRFTIHSWHDDNSVNEPWMYPEVLPIIREQIKFRYSLIPYLYSLMVEASETGHPIIRPFVYEFPDDESCIDESFDYMLGPYMLIGSVWEPGVRQRTIRLPKKNQWCDFATGAWHDGGGTVTVDTPMEHIATLMRGGAMIPTGKGEKLASRGSFKKDSAIDNHADEKSRDDKRIILAYPATSTESQFNLIEDDGITLGYKRGERTIIKLTMKSTADSIEIGAEFSQAGFNLQYSEIEWVFPQNEKREVKGADRVWKTDDGRVHASMQVPEELRQTSEKQTSSTARGE